MGVGTIPGTSVSIIFVGEHLEPTVGVNDEAVYVVTPVLTI